jgi:hypothetical protein
MIQSVIAANDNQHPDRLPAPSAALDQLAGSGYPQAGLPNPAPGARCPDTTEALLAQHAGEREQLQRDAAWRRRTDRLRQQQWEMGQKLLQTSRTLLRRLLKRPNLDASIAEIIRLLELASELGTRAVGLEPEKNELTARLEVSLRVQMEAALKKVYGQPLPGEIIECEPARQLPPAPEETRP